MKDRWLGILIVLAIVVIAGSLTGWYFCDREYQETLVKLEENRELVIQQQAEHKKELLVQEEAWQEKLEAQQADFEEQLRVQQADFEEQLRIQLVEFESSLEIIKAEHEISLIVEYKKGCQEGLEEGRVAGREEALSGKIILENPTSAQVENLLGGITWLRPLHSCTDYAAALNEIGEESGFRTAFVFLVYSYPQGGKWGHFINAFETSDEGLIFVEPETKERVEIEVGKPYCGHVVREIMIIW